MDDPSMLRLIERLSHDLEDEAIAHALTGSVAASLHAEPIMSLDVDIVVKMAPEAAKRIAARWKTELGADEYSFVRAARTCGMANLLHMPSGLKVDISVLPDEPFYSEILRRKVHFTVEGSGETFWIVTPEDIILMKLLWRKDTQSEKQWSNALNVARIRGHTLDWGYMRSWAQQLGFEADLNQLIREAGI